MKAVRGRGCRAAKDRKLLMKQRAFLAAYAELGVAAAAAEAAMIGLADHQRWLEDAEYREAFRLALERYMGRLELEVRKRALEGVEEPVFYRGEQCGTKRVYSDRLLELLLRMVRERTEQLEQAGAKGGRLEILVDGGLDPWIYGRGQQ